MPVYSISIKSQPSHPIKYLSPVCILYLHQLCCSSKSRYLHTKATIRRVCYLSRSTKQRSYFIPFLLKSKADSHVDKGGLNDGILLSHSLPQPQVIHQNLTAGGVCCIDKLHTLESHYVSLQITTYSFLGCLASALA